MHPAVHQAAVFGIHNRVMGELPGAAVVLRAASGTVVQPTGRELVAWCAARLAQYKVSMGQCTGAMCKLGWIKTEKNILGEKILAPFPILTSLLHQVPAVVHVLERMPATGSGKILKTELRKMFGSTAGGCAPQDPPAATAAATTTAVQAQQQAAYAPQLPTLPLPTMAAAAAALAAATNLPCEVATAGMGTTRDRQLLQGMAYLSVAPQAVDAPDLVQALVVGKGITSLALLCLEPLTPAQVAALHATLDAEGRRTSRLVVMALEPSDLMAEASERRALRTALAAAAVQLPPFAAVLRLPDDEPANALLPAAFGAAATAAQLEPASLPPAAEVASCVAVAAALHCEAVDAELGTAWGRQLLPGLAYLVVLPRAAEAEGLTQLLVQHKGLRHLALLATEPLAPAQLAALHAWLSTFNARQPAHDVACLVLVQLDAAALLQGSGDKQRRLFTALAAASERLPPFAAVLFPAGADGLVLADAAPPLATAALPLSMDATASAAPGAAHSEQRLRATIVDCLAPILGEELARALPGSEPLMSAGLTSSLAVQLVSTLEDALGALLPGTLAFDYPSLDEMAAFLAVEMGGEPATKAAITSAKPLVPASSTPLTRADIWPASAALPSTTPPAGQAQAQLAALVLHEVAALLGEAAANELTANTPLMSAGLTSSLAVQLVSALETALSCELPGTLVFDYPSAAEILQFLLERGVLPAETAQLAEDQHGQSVQKQQPQRQQQHDALVALVLREVAELLGGAAVTAADAPLMSAGLTSSLAVQLVAVLEAALQAELPGTLVFDFPSAANIADFLLDSGLEPTLLAMPPAAAVATAHQAVERPALVPQPTADVPVPVALALSRPPCLITAASHKVPGGSLVWQPETAGNDRIREAPLERWDVELPPMDAPGELNQHFGSFLR